MLLKYLKQETFKDGYSLALAEVSGGPYRVDFRDGPIVTEFRFPFKENALDFYRNILSSLTTTEHPGP